jgi:phosphatidylglycerophosphatase C
MNAAQAEAIAGAARTDLVLFDFDGTLADCESFPMFVRRVVPASRLRTGWLRLWPLVLGYRLGWVSGVRVRAAIARCAFTGVPVQELEAAGRAFAREVLPGLLMAPVWARLQAHRQRGDRVLIISGGLGVYLRPWAESVRLELLCSELEQVDGRYSGRFDGAQCVGAEKARRVRQHLDLADYAAVHAYGDTPEDAELLALADHAFYRWRG